MRFVAVDQPAVLDRRRKIFGPAASVRESGRGKFSCAAIIADEVYTQAAPIPPAAATPDRNRFFHDIIDAVNIAPPRNAGLAWSERS